MSLTQLFDINLRMHIDFQCSAIHTDINRTIIIRFTKCSIAIGRCTELIDFFFESDNLILGFLESRSELFILLPTAIHLLTSLIVFPL